jgi:hypothetical protein
MNLKKITDHIAHYEILYVMALALILGAIGGGWLRMVFHHCPECPKCPEIVARLHVERDSVVVHDTVRMVKYAPSITVVSRPSNDTAQRAVVRYEVIDTMPDQAVIGFSLASRGFTETYLPDLTHTAWYLAKPDRIKIISDTLTVQLPPLACPSRWQREVVIGGICLGVGAIAATAYFTFR